MAEETNLIGSEKMALVVSKLHAMVPAAFKAYFSEERLEKMAQWVFDWMRKYAVAYIHSHENDPENPDLTEIHTANEELTADMINKLSALSSEALKELAKKIDIPVDGMSDSDIIKAILFACVIKG